MKILALDVGVKTIGVAISDEEERWAFPAKTILRKLGWREDMAAIRDLVAKENVGKIVVGMPLQLSGQAGGQAQQVEEFLHVLRRNVRIPLEVVDERFTTVEAERVLRLMKADRAERKARVDSHAACLILQTYLDQRKNRS